MKFYMVGGYVRDELLGVKSKDIDYAVEANSYQEMLDYVKANGKVFLESPQHLTIRAHMKGKQPADFVLCRKDGTYSDGRRPDSVEPGTLMDDLARRDFTVNAIAKDDTSGELIDPFDGQADLKTMTLRCVGKPLDRFNEDALRVLRAMRFVITKGFRLELATAKAMTDWVVLEKLQTKISVDRKRDELSRCFAHGTLATMQFLAEAGKEFREAIFQDVNGKQVMWLEPTSKNV